MPVVAGVATIDFVGLQRVMYNRLKQSSALAALVRGVYDYVPEASDYPYVLFESFTLALDSSIDQSKLVMGEQILRAYSNDADVEKGSQTVRAITTVLFGLFHQVCLVLDIWRMQTQVTRVQIVRAEGTARSATIAVQILFI